MTKYVTVPATEARRRRTGFIADLPSLFPVCGNPADYYMRRGEEGVKRNAPRGAGPASIAAEAGTSAGYELVLISIGGRRRDPAMPFVLREGRLGRLPVWPRIYSGGELKDAPAC